MKKKQHKVKNKTDDIITEATNSQVVMYYMLPQMSHKMTKWM